MDDWNEATRLALAERNEREAWSDWWADVRGWVLCGLFVGTVLAFVTHVAGVWGA